MSLARMRSSSLASTRFPLPEGAFGPLSLSPAQRDAFRAQCEARVRAALDECERADSFGHEAYGAPWELAGMQDQCSVMRKRETATRAQYRLMADLVGDYKDMMELMYAETSHDTYEWMQFLYQEVVDAHLLESFEKGSPENAHHYFGVKWAVQQASMFSGKADQLFVEYMTYRKDLRGRDIGVRVMLPVRLGEVDHPMEAMKVRRLSSEVVIIMRPVYESKRSTTRLFVMVDNDFPGSVPTSYSRNLLGMAHNMPLCADSRRIRRRGLISEKSWVSNSSRRSCIVCTRNFGAARGRHHCRLCGDVICRKCMLVRDTADPVTKKTFKIAKTKFCVLCVTKLRLPDVEDFTNSGLVSAIKANAIEAAPIDLGDATRASHNSHNSLWSETESEDCRTDVEHSDSARSSISSSTEQDGGKPSLGLRLQDIAERSEDSATEDAGTKQPKPETVLFVPDETTDSEEFMITIDTKDMIRDGYSLNSSNPLSSSGVYDDPTNERRRSNPLSSIDQSLAEQEALLRQLVLATHGVTPSHNRHVDKRYGEYGH